MTIPEPPTPPETQLLAPPPPDPVLFVPGNPESLQSDLM
jgi:hypothetical protein